MTRSKAAKKTKVRNCIVINPPQTAEEREKVSSQLTRALALMLHRSLNSREQERLISALRSEVS